METNQIFQNLVKKKVSKLINEQMYETRKKKIANHVESCLSNFNDEVRKIALENNHPYVRVHLTLALDKIKQDIQENRIQALGIDEILLDPETVKY